MNMRADETVALLGFALNRVNEAAFLIDESARFHFVNESACRSLGYTRDELLAMGISDVDPDFPMESWPAQWAEMKEIGSLIFESRHKTKDGRIFPVEINTNYIEYGGKAYHIALIRDITERKNAEDMLHRVNRELRAISECNQVLMRATDESELLHEICRIICEVAAYRMAWVGFAENDEAKSVRPVAWAGTEDGYLENAGIVWADTYRGRGPTGTAIRTGKSVCIQDFTTDSIAEPWKESAIARGYRSNIGLPLADEQGVVTGALTIYSTEPNAFTPDEIRLLEELAGDLSFGISVLRGRIERQRAEEEREANLRFFESMDRVNRAMQGADNLEQMMSDVLDAVLQIFGCDRAWLLYSADPDAPSFSVPMERNRPEYPGAFTLKCDVPITAKSAEVIRLARDSSGPVSFGPGSCYPMPADIEKCFNVKSQIMMIIYPKTDKPYLFGLHQCSYARVWTQQDERLFQAIGRRLGDGLSSLVTFRQLSESEAKYRRIVETTSEGMWMLGSDLMTTFVNARMADMTGYSAEEIIGRPFTDFMFEEDVADHHRRLEARRKGMSESYERRIRHKSGKTMWTYISATPIFDAEHCFKGTLAMFTDITDRKQMEQTLRLREREYRTLVENSPDLIVRYDRELRRTYVNPAWEKASGLTAQEVVNLPMADTPRVPKPIVAEYIDKIKKVLETGVPEAIEFAWVNALGVNLHLEYTIVSEYNLQGEIISALSVGHDITAHKQMEEGINKLLHRNEMILNTAGEGIYGVDTDGCVTFINPAASKMLGWEGEELVGRNSHATWHYAWHDKTAFPAESCRLLGALKAGIGCTVYDDVFWRKDGTNFRVEYTCTPMIDGGEVTGGVVTFKDISERMKLEAQLFQAQKMEAVGLLAGGIAHDFNNMLTAIIGYANLLSLKLEKDSPLRFLVDPILGSAEKSANLTRQLLAFSRKQIIAPRATDINELLRGIEKLLIRLIGEDIDLVTRFADRPLIAMADPGQIEQVLMNLCTNARDAMPNGGMLSLVTDVVELDEDTAQVHDLKKAGAYVCISISDTGTGMNEAARLRIFEPFYSTKEQGQGTGLGLSIVYGIIKQHGGGITVYSEPGKG
ncbi:MAG TPA: PAS domain S-box protein, partial [Dissulfurispiraceae bacterium]|nr:PAS domain S-box protein [Dissulfurispiraceae bacterium]